MAVQRPDGFAVSVVREDGRWRCARMDDAALGELDAAITELRRIRSTGAAFGMLAVDDEFFILLRPTPGVPSRRKRAIILYPPPQNRA